MSGQTEARGTCRRCGGDIVWYEVTAYNGLEYDVLDSWWAHVVHPEDDHHAEVGG